MLYTVYVLHSKIYDKIYIGYTSDLIKRFYSHNIFGTKGYTMKYRPWEVIYTEVFSLKANALKREKELKSSCGRQFIRNMIQGSSLGHIR